METKEIIYSLRTQKGLSQEELAEKVFVTRQAVSRWETGETVPNTETLKLLSVLFDVSINTLLGSPRRLVCQCCGMPLTDDLLSRETGGSLNENYCKWCYADGKYTYDDMDDLLEVCVKHMASEAFPEPVARAYMKQLLPTLDYWKNKSGTENNYESLKSELIEEINALGVKGMPKIEKLNALVGSFVNLEYPLPNGETARFLKEDATYFGTQVPSLNEEGRCFGVVGNEAFLLVASYGEGGNDPTLVLYKKR